MSGIVLGDILGRGGEGVVHALASHPGYVGKVFHGPLDTEKQAHIEHLIDHATPQLAKQAAWPLALERQPDGTLVLISPRVEGSIEIHDFYGSATRRKHFPHATWADCVRIAESVACIEEGIHKAGFIHADLNEQNFLIDADGEPVLIDCDSVMSTHDGRTTYGGPYRDEWLPPELIGVDISTVERTRNHDCFALALLLFRILMLGRHPFVGAPNGESMPSNEEAIAGHHFVYAGMSPLMRPPDSAPAFEMLPPAIRKLFVQAFGREGRDKRPTAAEWRKALRTLLGNMRFCTVAGERHAYSKQLGEACPWCELAPRFDAFPEVSTRSQRSKMLREPMLRQSLHGSSPTPVPDQVIPPRMPRQSGQLPFWSWVQMVGVVMGIAAVTEMLLLALPP